MIDAQTLGKRIKYFRKRAGMSQLELEVAFGASSGMVSRIEHGNVNPSKETVLQIAKVLEMNDREVDYVIGSLVHPATQDETEKAIDAIRDHYSRNNVYAYLLDDRFRILHVSKGFENMFRKVVDDYDGIAEKILGDSIVKMMVDDTCGISPFLKTDEYYQTMYYQLARVKRHMGFMRDDYWYKRIEEVLKLDPKLPPLWEKCDMEDINFNDLKTRTIGLKIHGVKSNLILYREPQWKYPRFETVEYVPSNKFLRLLTKLFS